MGDHNPSIGGDGDGDGDDKPEKGNKHSYFLRAKTPRHHSLTDDDEAEFKKRLPPSKSDHFEEHSASIEEEDLANCLVMLSGKSQPLADHKGKQASEKGGGGGGGGMFQCKACKKLFNSHQALGGHRASHKKVKGCFAAKLDEEENVGDDSINEESEPLTASGSDPAPARKKAKMHECSVCHRVFSSGQALGGHKRCHWMTGSTDNAFIPSFQDFQYDHQSQKPMFTIPHHDQLDLNLNLPAPRRGDDNTSGLEESTRLLVQQQLGTATDSQQRATSAANDNGNKLRKLSDLKYGGSGWLQMGTASTAI